MGLWPYYSNALLYGDYANEANLHTRTKVHGIVTNESHCLPVLHLVILKFANEKARSFHF